MGCFNSVPNSIKEPDVKLSKSEEISPSLSNEKQTNRKGKLFRIDESQTTHKMDKFKDNFDKLNEMSSDMSEFSETELPDSQKTREKSNRRATDSKIRYAWTNKERKKKIGRYQSD